MQSIYDQLVHESSKQRRDLRYLKFIWIERDPVLIAESKFAQHVEERMSLSTVMHWDSEQSLMEDSGCLSSRLLAAFGPGKSTDEELEEEYSDDLSTPYDDRRDLETPESTSSSKKTTKAPKPIMDVQIYLTGVEPTAVDRSELPCVRLGRPNIKELFLEMKKEAIAAGECKVAVCVSAPRKLMELARQACILYSDENVRFDLHFESMAI